jgi:hypothetical protein
VNVVAVGSQIKQTIIIMYGVIIMNKDSTNKYSKWVFTLMEGGEYKSLPSSEDLGRALERVSDKFVFQLEECPSSGSKHFQGCLITRIRKRHRTLLVEICADAQVDLHQLTLDRMLGTWEQSVEYCSKSETKVGDRTFLSPDLKREEATKYKANDLKIFENGNFYPWQKDLLDFIFEDNSFNIKAASSRQVVWIEDLSGNCGKSIFTKYLCFNNPNITKLAFGSGSQMRASVVEEGAMGCYLIDIPRTLCNDDHKNNIFSVIEDIKGGHVKSSMYGKPRTLFFEPPIVIIFSNMQCPLEKLSVDRWKIFSIINNKLISIDDERLM